MEPINETAIRQLLERYHQGETSLLEERQLSDYFQQADLPHDLLPYRALFRFFQVEAAVSPPKKTLQKTSARRTIQRLLAPFAIAAAALIFFFSLYQLNNQDFVYIKDGQRIHNRNEALQLAQQQLEQASIRIQKANAMVEKLEQVTNYTETIHKYISK